MTHSDGEGKENETQEKWLHPTKHTHTHTHVYTHSNSAYTWTKCFGSILLLGGGGGARNGPQENGKVAANVLRLLLPDANKKKKKEKAAIWIIYLSGRYGRNKGQKQIPRSPPQTDSFHGIDWVWPDLFSLFFLEIFFFFSFPSSHTCFFSLPPFIREWRIWVSSWPVSVCPGWFSSRRFCAI